MNVSKELRHSDNGGYIYGRIVFANKKAEALRRKECLCLNCYKLEMKKCKIAKKLYKLCVKKDIAVMMTRCPEWSSSIKFDERKEKERCQRKTKRKKKTV